MGLGLASFEGGDDGGPEAIGSHFVRIESHHRVYYYPDNIDGEYYPGNNRLSINEKGFDMDNDRYTYTAFGEQRLIATGPIELVALKTKEWLERGGAPVLIFEDQTGQQIDLDLRGTNDEALACLWEHPWFQRQQAAEEKRTGRGRPKLGVVAREVTLLPRHWDWLSEQPGGTSVTLRKLVEETMRKSQGKDRARKSRDAASKFMWAMAGNLPDFEEASRAFSRKEYERFDGLIENWPDDIRGHVRRLVETAARDEKEAQDES